MYIFLHAGKTCRHYDYSCWQVKVPQSEQNPDAYDEESGESEGSEKSEDSDDDDDDDSPEITTDGLVGKDIPTSSTPDKVVGKDIPTARSNPDKGVGKHIPTASSVPAASAGNSPQSRTSDSNGSTPATGAGSGRTDIDIAFLGSEGFFYHI